MSKLEKDKDEDVKKRWETIKKALDHSTAFFNLEEAVEDEPKDDADQGQPDDQGEADDSSGDDDQQQQQEEDKGQMPEWLPEGMSVEGQDDQQPQDDETAPEDGQEEEPTEGSSDDDGSNGGDDDMEDVAQMLRDDGHSDAEIAHILHGHTVPQVDEAQRAKAQAEYAGIDRDQAEHDKEMELREKEAGIELDHNKRMKDVEYDRAQKESGLSDIEIEHAKKMKDLEYQKAQAEASVNEAKVKAEHAKRMLDLEYEVAKQQKALELDYKKKEMDMKLKHTDELASAKHKEKLSTAKEDAKFKAKQKQADRGSVKKSDHEEAELQKVQGWSFNPKTHQFNHPEFGSMAVRPSQSGTGFEMVHGGKVIAHHADPNSLKAGLTEYMGSLSKPLFIRDKVTTQAAPVQPAAGTVVPQTPSDSPYTKPNQVEHAQKLRDMDRQDRANTPTYNPSHKYDKIRDKGGQVMDIPEKKYINIKDKV